MHGAYIGLSFRKDYKETAIHIHRAMALAFIPNPENKKQVNHKNGIKTDNRLENFEWNTPKENTQHALKNGLLRVSDQHPQCKIKERQIPKIKALFNSGKSRTKIAEIYGVCTQTICNVIDGKRIIIRQL